MEQERADSVSLGWVPQFFVGGAILFVVAAVVMSQTATTEYDGGLSAIGGAASAVVVALLSIGLAFAVGSPLRVVPRWTRWWLKHGEFSVLGVLAGLVGCAVSLASAPLRTLTGEFGSFAVRDVNGWALGVSWAVLAFSVAHFVWPFRWSRRAGRHAPS